jgi:hypothetical protein
VSDFEEQARRASEALRRHAEEISDTEAALADVLAGPDVAINEPGADGWSRRRIYGFGVIVIGTAAAVVGIAVSVTDERDARIVEPATNPTTAATTVPATSDLTTTTADSTTTLTSPTTTARPSSPPADWVPSQPAEPAPPELSDVPRLIVQTTADRHVRYRRESGPARSERTYVQAYSTADGHGDLYVTTVAGPGPVPTMTVGASPTDPIGPWTAFESSDPQLILQHGNLEVWFESNLLTRTELREVAARLAPRRDGGPGWQVSPVPRGLAPVAEGYWWVGIGRSDVVVDVETGRPVTQLNLGLDVSGAAFPLASAEAGNHEIVDFDGQRAAFVQFDSAYAFLFWEYAPGVYAQLFQPGTRSPEELMQTARERIVPVSAAEWDASPPLPTGDGCPPIFDC